MSFRVHNAFCYNIKNYSDAVSVILNIYINLINFSKVKIETFQYKFGISSHRSELKIVLEKNCRSTFALHVQYDQNMKANDQ